MGFYKYCRLTVFLDFMGAADKVWLYRPSLCQMHLLAATCNENINHRNEFCQILYCKIKQNIKILSDTRGHGSRGTKCCFSVSTRQNFHVTSPFPVSPTRLPKQFESNGLHFLLDFYCEYFTEFVISLFSTRQPPWCRKYSSTKLCPGAC